MKVKISMSAAVASPQFVKSIADVISKVTGQKNVEKQIKPMGPPFKTLILAESKAREVLNALKKAGYLVEGKLKWREGDEECVFVYKDEQAKKKNTDFIWVVTEGQLDGDGVDGEFGVKFFSQKQRT